MNFALRLFIMYISIHKQSKSEETLIKKKNFFTAHPWTQEPKNSWTHERAFPQLCVFEKVKILLQYKAK